MTIRDPLSLSQAQGIVRYPAHIKAHPEDWRVTEDLNRRFADTGEHIYLYIRKRCLNTILVVSRLAKAFDVPAMDVGYAGLKDKHAVTEQWFSVRDPSKGPGFDVSRLNQTEGDQEIKVLHCRRDRKKLRRGEHQANHFSIVLRDVGAEIDQAKLQYRLESGFPNYFGPQRFGRHNLDDALNWLRHRRDQGRYRRLSQRQKGWHLSVLRSWVFNELLAARVRDETWRICLDGDDVGPSQTGQTDIPYGPLWGRGTNTLSGPALKRQEHWMAEVRTPDEEQSLSEVCAGLEYAGVDRALRPMAVTPQNIAIAHDRQKATLSLDFSLPVGAYATVLLSQWFDLQDLSSASAS